MVSGLYLGLSIYRIKKLIKAKGIEVNTKIMILHAATFGFYVFSTILWPLTNMYKVKDFYIIALASIIVCSSAT